MGSVPEESRPFSKIIITGGGPTGLLLAIFLGKQGIHVTILEAWDRLDERLRATQYGPPASRVFQRAGVLEDFRASGIVSFKSIAWRKVDEDQSKIVEIDLGVSADRPDRMTVLPLNVVLQILLKHCQKLPSVEILFQHKVVKLGQDEGKAWVDVETPNEGMKRFEGDYVIGCDGSTSTIRKELYGREWPGVTWSHHLLVQNVYYDGFTKHGWSGGNYMVDPEHWGLIAERGKGGLWRVTYGDVEGFSGEEYLKRRDWHFKNMLPGHPDPDQYRVEQTNHFHIHNRCVDSMKVGRVLLAGDSAHVCNPFGGYGLMNAVLDINGLAECLIGLYQGRAGEDILDKYAEIRREKFLKYIDPRSVKNMRRLHAQNPDTLLEDDKFMRLLKDYESKPDELKEFLLKDSSIEHDFTQYYTS